MIDENDARLKPLNPLEDGWTFEMAEFKDGGYVLYTPSGDYLRDYYTNQIIIWPTFRSMLTYVRSRVQQEAENSAYKKDRK